ncbi:hypothetical protein GCM10023220_71200 [Streptomyces ziwulingensis]|uniref:Uncharacterized protein n=1 Tax=Streptomyces ziwulingensis TaxID=1045501 RepID=A0ABP9D7R5_9ACTN
MPWATRVSRPEAGAQRSYARSMVTAPRNPSDEVVVIVDITPSDGAGTGKRCASTQVSPVAALAQGPSIASAPGT